MEPRIIFKGHPTYYSIKVEGPFDIKAVVKIHPKLKGLIGTEYVYFIFDLESSTLIDSSGIGLLANIYKKAEGFGGGIVILNPRVNLRGPLESSFGKSIPFAGSYQQAERHIKF